MSTAAVVTMVVASLLLGGGLLVSIASAVRAERAGKGAATADPVVGGAGASGAGGDGGTDVGGRAGAVDDDGGPGDGAGGAPLPPVQPRRGTGPAADVEVVADGRWDRAELEAFVGARVPTASPTAVRDVLDLYDEHLMVKGIAEVPSGYRWRFYDPDDPRVVRDHVVDAEVVTADAVRLLDVDGPTVDRILDAELAYLEAKGLTG